MQGQGTQINGEQPTMNTEQLVDLLKSVLLEVSPRQGRLVQTPEALELRGLSVTKMDKVVHGVCLKLTLSDPLHLSISHGEKVLLEMDSWRDITDPLRDPRFRHLLVSCLFKAFDKVKDKEKNSVGNTTYVDTGSMRRAEMIGRVVGSYLSQRDGE